MTNMTRRNFLKSAGVMALAVAAAGVLSGCDSSSKNPVMADVKVEYWREKNNWLQDLHIGDGAYDETVSVVKSGKVKKEQLQKLGKVMVNTGYKLSDSTATEFDVVDPGAPGGKGLDEALSLPREATEKQQHPRQCVGSAQRGCCFMVYLLFHLCPFGMGRPSTSAMPTASATATLKVEMPLASERAFSPWMK